MLFVPGAMALVSVPVAVAFRECRGVEALLMTAIVSLPLGWFLYYRVPSRVRLLR